jgi:DNA-binding NtrC family response regulator
MQTETTQDSSAQAPRNQFRAKLLVIDGDVDELLYYSRVLERAGYDVRCIASFTDAASSLERESFDLIITSRGSSDFTGRTVLARVIDHHRETPVVVLDRHAGAALFLDVMPLSCQHNQEKLLPPSEIESLVKSYLSDGAGREKKQQAG